MKIVTAQTMQNLDRQAIVEHKIPGLQLMENAGRCCADILIANYGTTAGNKAVVIAGKGNNGGDGYVIARLLSETGWNVSVYILAEREQISGDAAANLDKLPAGMSNFCPCEGQLSALKNDIFQADVIVDALFGTGVRNDLTGVYLEAVRLINASSKPVLAVDIPSGIHGTTGRVLGDAVHADTTVTFAFAKLGHMLYPGAEHTGKLIVADIGIPASLMDVAPGYELLTSDSIGSMLRPRNRTAHKGDFGHCLIIAGSTGKTGAAALCANSAVRTGSGLVTLGVPESLNAVLEVKTTEAMTVALHDSGTGHLTSSAFPAIEKLLAGKDAIAVGPGLDRRPDTVSLIQTLIEIITAPLVIDADGLNALSEDVSVLKRKKSESVILTPHPGEMSRLLGVGIPDVEAERIAVAQEFASDYSVYLILKGARTIIASPSGVAAINSSGNPGMASGGMGDILTGILVSLLGQGYSAWDACRIGVFIHGYAADMVAGDKGEIGINATDVQEKLPYACKRLMSSNR
ncbi:NAD(P)H-hydrate dehydratase [Pelotalea chapellei]|uniref:Bifunctional NAD(P)H-hydrate repair enzyme n=1 Tax=Pelotalea chapellei TaxID=44671 RepID=A0ABS5U489_9BACT|nr:NAD(P)H-hydrate dehydratase [Pelotalea chapellei]MBT1070491.1 NAD(P)H-hydrate dehydratase [Pelotalea chapellei]